MSVAARKIATLDRCIRRAKDEYLRASDSFRTDFTRQDAAILNVTRACEAVIDLANIVIRERRLGIPSESRESFSILERSGLIPSQMSQRLRSMVGFRNIAVHQYQELDLAIVESVIRDQLDELLRFAELIRGYVKEI